MQGVDTIKQIFACSNYIIANDIKYDILIVAHSWCFRKMQDNVPILPKIGHEERGGKMLCHLVIDLNKKLCTRSDDRAKLVQR